MPDVGSPAQVTRNVMLRKIIQICAVFLIAGCTSKPELNLCHKIHVPKEYRYGKGSPYGFSSYERYLNSYERTFWSCVENRAKDIDYKYTLGDIAGCGWPCAVDGYYDGYIHAEKMINQFVKIYGKEKTQEYLKGVIGDGI